MGEFVPTYAFLKRKGRIGLTKKEGNMALRKSFTTKAGVGGDYINVQPTFKDKTTVLLKIDFWKDQATRNISGAIPLNDQLVGANDDRIVGFKCLYEFTYNLESTDNIYVQAYNYLKTQPEFADAVDC